MPKSLASLLLAACLLAGCSRQPSPFEQATSDFVYSTLALSPVSATQAGYHTHQGVNLDSLLDDFSPAAIARQRDFYHGFRSRLAAFSPSALSPEDRADLRIMQDEISLALLELDSIQSYRHNPTVYVELIGNALFTPFSLNYAPAPERYAQIIARLNALPAFLAQAQANLADAPEVWNRVAREEDQGNIALIDDTLRNAAPPSLRASYDRAAAAALQSLHAFDDFLAGPLAAKTSDWRLGPQLYAEKFRLSLATGKTPEQTLHEAEAQLRSTREEMARLAAPATVRQALDAIARRHTTPDHYLDEARADLEQARQFVEARGLVPLPSGEQLNVIPTPEFMRGIYGVGGFNPAPPLDPSLGAFYWITPIPSDWPPERVESKLREYNEYGLQHITIHEAMPGHWVQFEYSNRVEPLSRRLLRALYGNGPYVEGWAVYAQQLMTDQGYLNGDPGLRLTYLKQMLRVLANTILDVRLQTMGMTDQQALDLMINDAFQEREEAVAKLQRAQLSSCQLPTYFVGWSGWHEVLAHDQARMRERFNLPDFHRRALSEGAVPLPVLDSLLAAQ